MKITFAPQNLASRPSLPHFVIARRGSLKIAGARPNASSEFLDPRLSGESRPTAKVQASQNTHGTSPPPPPIQQPTVNHDQHVSWPQSPGSQADPSPSKKETSSSIFNLWSHRPSTVRQTTHASVLLEGPRDVDAPVSDPKSRGYPVWRFRNSTLAEERFSGSRA